MQLIHGTKVKKALCALHAEKIAVAYIGADWQSFVNIDALTEIIVSPTIGSSADAISELVAHLGWDNVHFLDELHAKIYLGAKSAAVGSFNLTANGLSGHALAEAGYIINAPSELKELRLLYKRFKALARSEYNSQAKKEKQLSWLKESNDKLRGAGAKIGRSASTRTLANYEPTTDTDFYCSFYECEELELNVEVIRDLAPEKFLTTDVDLDDLFRNRLPFLNRDKVMGGHWLLMWKAGEKVTVPTKFEVEWMYINRVFPKGAVDEKNGYTKLAIQWSNARGFGAPPFHIGRLEKAALRKLLASGAFPEFLPHSTGRYWSLNKTFPRFKEFVAEWKTLASL